MATKDEHREFIQRVQNEAAAFGMEPSFNTHRSKHSGEIFEHEFVVFWNGDKTLAREANPMTDKAYWTTYPELWERIKAEAGDAIARS